MKSGRSHGLGHDIHTPLVLTPLLAGPDLSVGPVYFYFHRLPPNFSWRDRSRSTSAGLRGLPAAGERSTVRLLEGEEEKRPGWTCRLRTSDVVRSRNVGPRSSGDPPRDRSFIPSRFSPVAGPLEGPWRPRRAENLPVAFLFTVRGRGLAGRPRLPRRPGLRRASPPAARTASR